MSMNDMLYLGPTPSNESCVPAGGDESLQLKESRRYIEQIRLQFGPEPDGARLKVQWQNHEFGRYTEVVCQYDPENEAAAAYAFACEDAWGDWQDAVEGVEAGQ